MKRFIPYLLRWEASSLVLAPCLAFLGGLGVIPATIIANALGAIIFYQVDKLIFKEKK